MAEEDKTVETTETDELLVSDSAGADEHEDVAEIEVIEYGDGE